jgi:hypothetical protein
VRSQPFEDDWFFGVKKYRALLEAFYRWYCYEQRYVFVDRSPCSNRLQREWKIDTLVQKDAQSSQSVEEKIVKWPKTDLAYTAFFLETYSCTNQGYESPGWMSTSQADLLLYAFEIKDVGLVAYVLDFPRLQRWFWEQYLPALPHPEHGRSVMAQFNHTEERLVPIATVVKHIPTECFLLPFEGGCQRLKPVVHLQRLRERYLQRKGEGLSPFSSDRKSRSRTDLEGGDACL